MKTNIKCQLNLFCIFFILLITSCGGSSEEVKTPVSSSGSSFLSEGAITYDAKAIDPKAPVVEITLNAQGLSMAEMSYDKAELKVAAGSTILLTLENKSTDESMPHNFVLVQKGEEKFVADAGLKAGLDANYVPSIEEVLVSTKMLKPGEKVIITFPAPPKGEYPYICTYPGHYTIMKGKLIVE